MLKVLKHIPVVLIIFLWLWATMLCSPELMHGNTVGKWLWIQMIAAVSIVFIVFNLVFLYKRMQLSRLDLGITILVLWLMVNSHDDYLSLVKISAVSILYLFVRLFSWSDGIVKTVLVGYLTVMVIQCLIGLLQLYGLFPSNHSQFAISGSFHNPGPFSGFVVSGLPMALGLYKLTVNNRQGTVISNQLAVNSNLLVRIKYQFNKINSERLLNYFSQVVIVLLLLVLPAARSRAAWLGGLAGCAYVLWHFRKEVKVSLRTSVSALRISVLQKRWFVILVLVLLFVGGVYGLYKFKQGSADGRLLMWQVSWEMIKDKPIIGWGPGGFEAHYGNYQAEWFKSGKGTPEHELVAGIPEAPFNEFIRIWIEYGLVGVLLVFGMLYFCYTETHRVNTKLHGEYSARQRIFVLLKGSLLSIIVFSLFSYPLDVAPIVVQMVILIALIANLQPLNRQSLMSKSYKLKPLFSTLTAIILLPLAFWLVIQTINQYQGHKHWKEAYQLYQYQIYDDAAEEYLLAMGYLPGNGLLLQMYGKCLTMSVNRDQYSVISEELSVVREKLGNAKELLEQAAQLRSDPILYTTLGDTYKALGLIEQAEKAYLHAWQMVPHKFYPKYLLAKLYNQNGLIQQATKIAKELLEKEVKVESRAIEEIRSELNRLLQK